MKMSIYVRIPGFCRDTVRWPFITQARTLPKDKDGAITIPGQGAQTGWFQVKEPMVNLHIGKLPRTGINKPSPSPCCATY